jgi:hypothetical protein
MPPEVRSRRFPPPWVVDETEACFIVRDAWQFGMIGSFI